MTLTRLLIANRGEIAVRVARAADALGIPTVGVHTPDDADSGHVFAVTEAVPLPGSGVAGYLDGKELIRVASSRGCDAVHPGYGFLAESAAFARNCETAGLTFVGPSPETLDLFGDKANARAHVASLGVPLLEATGPESTLEESRELLAGLGADGAVMVKAVAGGGGRGIRAVRDPDDLAEAFARCSSEARAAFGDGRIYVERALPGARHVEVQIIGDGATVTHLWDRDCSVQRRFQKLLEVAPVSGLDPAVRQEVLAAAVRIGESVGYRGLGTVEFLVAGGTWVFMELNPRVQVEHTVTEEITGVDLVQAQLRVLQGESLAALGLAGPPPEPAGVAIQARVNAERLLPGGGIEPGLGTLARFVPPGGRGVRVDTHAYAGLRVTGRYDSLLAKVIAHEPGGDRARASDLLRRALRELTVDGVPTTSALLATILEGEAFRSGDVAVDYLDAHLDALLGSDQPVPLTPPAAAASGTSGTEVVAHEVPVGFVGVTAAIQGSVVDVPVGVGEAVAAGAPVVVVEAMKMEHALVAERSGVVDRVLVEVGDVVPAGAVVALLAPAEVDAGDAGGDGTDDAGGIRPDLAAVLERRALGLDENRPEAVARRHATGHRTARENIADLCDPGSFQEYGAFVVAGQRRRREFDDLIRNTPADGLVGGIGTIDGRRCVVMSYDYMVLAGTQGLQNHKKTDRLIDVAARHSLPLVFFVEGGGGRPGDTDGFPVASLDIPTFGTFARLSGRVPTIAIVSGYCFAGNAALAACCDVIIATEDTNLGMGGPAMIRSGGLGEVAARDIGTMSIQEPNGVVDVVVSDEAAAVATAKQYLSYFGGRAEEWTAAEQSSLREAMPRNRRRAYDARPIIETIADTGSALELRPRFGVGIHTVLARIEGRPVGIVANNARHLGGAIDSDAADKAARFLRLCDVYALPVVSFCDTPGFMVGNDAERTASVRHFGRMFVAGGNLQVPLCVVVLRKAYGLAPMAMSGGGMKNPVLTVAWPTGEFGGMALEGAVELAYRRVLEAIDDPDRRQEKYAELLAEMYDRGSALSAATQHELDDVIDPADTRAALAAALDSVVVPAPGARHAYVDPW